ncbi:CPBP family intramembrane glutamic endopeptidase [Carboxylicivirga linearis]|uniref:CPBP family intramembrane metalloprotease n=1 Tax=Carboxylicivirga linearis TaxID=1628157 RepID=A0ABS5JTG9_9BACT|nr:CPBP family intramembrane glutamic endopeptidase [Carboxylicivirga linearis]MBS2097741.1 CPBP family intramembrane metalloprotease [Carboxylicivirga linearis]
MKHLESALKTKNDWWAYLVIIVVSFFIAQVVGGIPLGIVLATADGGMQALSEGNVIDFTSLGINSSFGLALIVIPFIVSFFTLKALVKPLHQRSFTQVINGRGKVRYRRIFYGFLIWGIITVFSILVDYYMNIGNYQVRFDPKALIVLTLVAFLMLPFQTFFEEIFVRGYLAQGVGALTKNRIAVLIIPSMAFALLHAVNPEVVKHGFWLMMSQYFAIGLIFALTSVLDDGIELAMGAHAANNIFVSILVTSKSSALQTDSLLRDMNDVVSWDDLYSVLLLGLVFIGLFGFKYKWKWKTLTKKIEL